MKMLDPARTTRAGAALGMARSVDSEEPPPPLPPPRTSYSASPIHAGIPMLSSQPSPFQQAFALAYKVPAKTSGASSSMASGPAFGPFHSFTPHASAQPSRAHVHHAFAQRHASSGS